MLDQDVAPVIGELGVFDLADGDLELLAEAVPKAAHGWRAVFPDLGRGERGPARFAVAGLGDQDDLRAEFEERAGGLGLAGFGEGEQDHVEGPRHFAQQVKDADRAAVGERVGQVGGEELGGGGGGAVALPGAEPAGPQEDAVEGHAAQEKPGGEGGAQFQMMALEAGVVGQYPGGGEKEGRAPEGAVAGVRCEQHGGEADTEAAEPAAQLAGRRVALARPPAAAPCPAGVAVSIDPARQAIRAQGTQTS